MAQRRRSTSSFRSESAPGRAKRKGRRPPQLKYWGGDSDVMELRYDSSCCTCGVRLPRGTWAHLRSKSPWRFECILCQEAKEKERKALRQKLRDQVRSESTGKSIDPEHPLVHPPGLVVSSGKRRQQRGG